MERPCTGHLWLTCSAGRGHTRPVRGDLNVLVLDAGARRNLVVSVVSEPSQVHG